MKKSGHWLFLLASLVALPGLFLWNSIHKIDRFCDGINETTGIDEMKSWAKSSGVDLHGPIEYPNRHGVYFYFASSPGTGGEYQCRIDVDEHRIIKKYSGSLGTI